MYFGYFFKIAIVLLPCLYLMIAKEFFGDKSLNNETRSIMETSSIMLTE